MMREVTPPNQFDPFSSRLVLFSPGSDGTMASEYEAFDEDAETPVDLLTAETKKVLEKMNKATSMDNPFTELAKQLLLKFSDPSEICEVFGTGDNAKIAHFFAKILKNPDTCEWLESIANVCSLCLYGEW